jgi:hypothetical protein
MRSGAYCSGVEGPAFSGAYDPSIHSEAIVHQAEAYLATAGACSFVSTGNATITSFGLA